jgi:hypothetical protein
MVIRQVGAILMHEDRLTERQIDRETDRQTDGDGRTDVTKLIAAFYLYANAPKKCIED